jgi:EmrB/QacA subfamily drug resistance transporter
MSTTTPLDRLGPTTDERALGPGPLVVLCLAQLMVLLDGTIVSIALPSVVRDLHVSPESMQWTVNAYYLAFGGLLLLGGRIGDLVGRRRTLVAGVALFALGSLLGGLSTTGALLVAARAVQGLGAAAAAPAVLALLAASYPQPRARARALAVYATMGGVGAASGLILGGLLTEWVSWRWVFFVNLPLALVVLLAAPRILPAPPRGMGRLDVAGSLTATGGLTLLVYAVTRAGAEGWSDPRVLGSLAGSAALLAAFVVVERRTTHPLLPLRLVADRTRAGAFLLAAMAGAVMFVLFFVGSQFSQGVLQASPVRTGVQFVPFSATVMLTAQLVARVLVHRVRPAVLALTGGALAVVAMALLARIDVSSTYPVDLLGPMLLCALGMGLTMVPLTLLVMARIEPSNTGVAAGVLTTAQQIGGVTGLALAATAAAGVSARLAATGPASAAVVATAGYARSFEVAAVVALVLVLTAAALLLPRRAASG